MGPSRRRALVSAGAILFASATAQAVVPRSAPLVPAQTLTALPAAGTRKPLRTTRPLKFGERATASWQRFQAASGGTWRAAWDPATGVPSRIWGHGIAAPGATASPAIAEQLARRVLADHLALLAPGASIGDFVLVSNHWDGDQRSVGFAQYAAGRRVVGGQVSFRFKRDRLFVIASEALPNVVVPATTRLTHHELHLRATDDLRVRLGLAGAPVRPRGDDEVILPLVGDDAVIAYRVAVPIEVDGGADGRYLAYVDPATGVGLAVLQQNAYATGTLLYKAVDRYPAHPRVDHPASRAHVLVGGAPKTTGADGALSWTPDVGQTVATAVVGDLAQIVNQGEGGELATTQVALSPGGSAVWDATALPEDEAQLNVYVAITRVKDYVRANLDPEMPTLEDSIVANVNIPQQCNAFFDGETINFFHATDACENTGRIEDVIYHEFGHGVHFHEVIEGVGAFDGAMSEGAADFLAASITGDPGMGRGFFYTDEPLRQLDPPNGEEAVWPRDIGEIHTTGIIFGGTFWDLRKALIASLGEAEGVARTNKLYLAALRRAVSIPTSLIEALAADDDDGDLANGTPNECAIRDAFGRHGLRTATGTILAPGAVDDHAAATVVRADLSGLSERCGGDDIAGVTIEWRPGFTPEPERGSVDMTQVSPTRYWAQLPLARDGVVHFHANVQFADGSELVLPDNFAAPNYTVYQGSTVKLYCTDFEAGNPLDDGWTTGTSDGSASPWQWGEPGGGATDPPVAFSGSKVMAQVLGGDYAANQYSFLKMPPIDVGQYSDVRLQFRRWLAVEDSEFDKARVTVNGKQAFVNFSANMGDRSSTHHIDREWIFTDIGISGYGPGHKLEVAWDLSTDPGLQLGGWAIDDVCVVANRSSICGDGVKNLFEQCDDGPDNADEPGKCRTFCQLPQCGDEIIDGNEECDDGDGGSPTCTATCQIQDDGSGGCCSTGGGGGAGALALGAVVGGLVLRRRRRR